MFNLANLNDYEFELLCKDLMEKKLSLELHTFSRGIDGGVDICDADKRHIIQVKHYTSSRYDKLYRSLKKEVKNVKSLSPEHYYVCTSLRLTKNNKENIVELFEGYIKNISSIIDGVEIDNFLQLTENEEVVAKHYKLWLSATSILSVIDNQNVFIDCEELISDIKKHITLFVDTSAYYEARSKLIDNGIVIITGAPGVGKSTVSKMLLIYFADQGYTVRYTTDNTISYLKKVLSQNPSKKEIILLDDFLGQHYLKIKESKPNELKTLMSFIEKNPFKKLIMNSRITIFNEALQSSILFNELMETYELGRYLIDLDTLPIFEKAKILYNHLYFNNLPDKYFLNVKSNENYLKIVRHKNYNPRLIEYVTKEQVFSLVSHTEYSQFIFDKLNNPEDIWRDEFRNRLENVDRIMIHTLYSLTNTSIEIALLELAFNKRIENVASIDTSTNIFKNTLTRLSESILKVFEDKNKIKVSVINPSVNDYVSAEITKNLAEQISIVNSSMFIEQLMKIARSDGAKKLIIDKIIDGSLLQMSVLEKSPFYYFLSLVVEWNILKKEIIDNFLLSIEYAYRNLTEDDMYDYGLLINELTYNDKIYSIYNVQSVLCDPDKLDCVLLWMHLDELNYLFDSLIDKGSLSDECFTIIRQYIIGRMIEYIQDIEDEELEELVPEFLSNFNKSEVIDNLNGEKNAIEKMVLDKLSYIVHEDMKELIENTNKLLEIKIEDLEMNEVILSMDVMGMLDAYLDLPRYKNNEDNDWYYNFKRGIEDVTRLFER